jgi:cyclopropane-fatty-acyl-phospholipid synthase
MNLAHKVAHVLRPNSLRTSRRNIAEHYDLSNEFFALWLDPTMTYSAGYWDSPEMTLEQAQMRKYDVLCRKLRLQPSDHVLEIGSGWGGFSMHAAKNFGCRVTTVTISQAQFDEASRRIASAGLAGRIDLRLQDYRQLTGQFDKIASIEMLEAVGDKYLDGYFSQCHRLLKRKGLLGLQYITCPDAQYAVLRRGVDFIQRHIFPGSLLNSIGRVNQALNKTGDLFLHDLDDMGPYYARTLHVWRENFHRALDEVRAQRFDETFIRKWDYYLAYCEAAFASRHISVVQAIYTRADNETLDWPTGLNRGCS